MTMAPDPEVPSGPSMSDDEISQLFWVKPLEGTHVTALHCKCGAEILAENPWIRGARDHVESGQCRLA